VGRERRGGRGEGVGGDIQEKGGRDGGEGVKRRSKGRVSEGG